MMVLLSVLHKLGLSVKACATCVVVGGLVTESVDSQESPTGEDRPRVPGTTNSGPKELSRSGLNKQH